MKVKMLTDAKGSENGYIVNEYYKDQLYDISNELAKSFISSGLAVECTDYKVELEPENKMLDEPVNKALKSRKTKRD